MKHSLGSKYTKNAFVAETMGQERKKEMEWRGKERKEREKTPTK